MITDDRVRSYLASIEPGLSDELRSLEDDALKRNVPIIKKETQALLRFVLRERKPSSILEIGTAVGFSARFFDEMLSGKVTIHTIEKVPARIDDASSNFLNRKNITLITGDAIDVLRHLACDEEDFAEEIGAICAGETITIPKKPESGYDLIFLDAAKAQYMSYLPFITKLLHRDGLFITDNILQEGTLAGSKFAVERRDRTIHMRMREYVFELTHNEVYNSVLVPAGDGVMLTTLNQPV